MIPMGKLLRQLRKEKKWTQGQLLGELSSKTVLSKIETGSGEADIFLLESLMSRLGKTLRFFEIVVNDSECEILQYRMHIKENLLDGKFDEAGMLLEKYINMAGKKAELHHDYIRKVRFAVEKKQYQPELFETGDYKVIISENELIRDIRKERGLSQEQLSENICARETVSNMEHGRKPNRKMWKCLMKKLGELQYTYYGYVVATDFFTYELVEQYQIATKNDRENAKKLLKEIKKRLDTTLLVNRQFLEASELIDKLHTGKLSPAETMAGLERVLRYTMPEYDGNLYRIPHCEEVKILETVCFCLRKVGRAEAAVILEQELQNKNRKKLKVS